MNYSHLPAVTMLEYVMTALGPFKFKSFFPESCYDLATIQLYTLIHTINISPSQEYLLKKLKNAGDLPGMM
jgi:hypothetical protein